MKLNIRKSRQAYTCDVCGCRNRTHNLVSKRSDYMARWLHICSECIHAMNEIITEREEKERADAPVPAEEEKREEVAEEPKKEQVDDSPAKTAPKKSASGKTGTKKASQK